MDKNTQAKNGFKTFVVTLSVSLVIFSAIYYFVTDYSSSVDIESFGKEVASTEVKGDTDVAEAMEEKETVFATINAADIEGNPRVLGGADTTETTESTVPDTGSETLIGTMLAMGAFGVAVYALFVGPRKMALTSFENSLTRD